MKYERLTIVDKDGNIDITGMWDVDMRREDDKKYHAAKNRLAELEDKIENGTLVELPCKVGDKVYKFNINSNRELYILAGKVIKIEFRKTGILYFFDIFTNKYLHEDFFANIKDDFIDVDKYYICSKEEAEARLKELKGE